MNEVKYVQGNLKEKKFLDSLLEDLNPRETTRLLKVVTELVADGHTNLFIWGKFEKFRKCIWVKDCDIPAPERGVDNWYSFDPSALGSFWLSNTW